MEEITLAAGLPQDTIAEQTRNKQIEKKERVLEFFRYFFIVLFTYAAIRKLVNYQMFIKEISGYTFLRSNTKWALGALSGVEIITVVLLAIPKTQLCGYQFSFGILVFLNILSFIILQVCPCVMPALYGGIMPSFSKDGIPTFSFFDHLIFNIVMLFLSLIALLLKLRLEKQKWIQDCLSAK